MRHPRALLILMVVACAGCTSASPATRAAAPTTRPGPSSGGVALPARGCDAALTIGPLPVWARSGFSPPAASVPHVLGVKGNIVAILFAGRDSLHAPPLANQANKVLWVSRLDPLPSGGPMTIEATLNGTSRRASRTLINGPGPSYVNLPAAGCWTLSLNWSGHQDQVELRYVAS